MDSRQWIPVGKGGADVPAVDHPIDGVCTNTHQTGTGIGSWQLWSLVSLGMFRQAWARGGGAIITIRSLTTIYWGQTTLDLQGYLHKSILCLINKDRFCLNFS